MVRLPWPAGDEEAIGAELLFCGDCGVSVVSARLRRRVLPMLTIPGGRMVETRTLCVACDARLEPEEPVRGPQARSSSSRE